jgi:hypothetical protein
MEQLTDHLSGVGVRSVALPKPADLQIVSVRESDHHEEQEHVMNNSQHDPHEQSGTSSSDGRDQPARPQQPAPEVHRERELIVTDGGGRGSGPGTVVMVIFAFVALIVVGLLAFTFLQRDGGGIVPDELDINIVVPEMPGGTGGS